MSDVKDRIMGFETKGCVHQRVLFFTVREIRHILCSMEPIQL